jgi:superoxide dismutase, Fe-Mn family
MTRRRAIKVAAMVSLCTATVRSASAQSLIDGRLQPQFELPPLPYAFDALEPHIDARTMEIHHDKHHAAYVGNLDKALSLSFKFYFEVKAKRRTQNILDYLVKNLASVPDEMRPAVRNNGGGHYNHSLFWQMMKKNGGGEPKHELAAAIEKGFGSFAGFKEQFTKAALGRFGSGWAWLVAEAGKLGIETTSNQDNPIMGRAVAGCEGKPLLGCDVWEHAYYLKYQNQRADYLAAWFKVVDWDFVAARFAEA